ncbi:hypothetical protein [Streptomyces erythrochromogenes]|uniref:hypothetical protein n=1 Tax=Streptomyces erythrochromogenes TaxID=285574 RepID=UPI003800A6C4
MQYATGTVLVGRLVAAALTSPTTPLGVLVASRPGVFPTVARTRSAPALAAAGSGHGGEAGPRAWGCGRVERIVLDGDGDGDGDGDADLPGR